MSVRSGSSGSTSRGQYKEFRLPNTLAVKALVYFCGRNPRKAKSVRRYYYDDFDTRSNGSGGSAWSWASGRSQVYLVESTVPYWDDFADSASFRSEKRKSSGRGRTSRASQGSNPSSAWARKAAVRDSDDDEDDDSSSDGSFDDYAGQRGAYPPPPPPPPPSHLPSGMMPPPQGPPPPGAFRPVQGFRPQRATTPRPTPPNGFQPPPPPPPPPSAPAAASPPPPGGHFVPGRGGIQVFVDG